MHTFNLISYAISGEEITFTHTSMTKHVLNYLLTLFIKFIY